MPFIQYYFFPSENACRHLDGGVGDEREKTGAELTWWSAVARSGTQRWRISTFDASRGGRTGHTASGARRRSCKTDWTQLAPTDRPTERERRLPPKGALSSATSVLFSATSRRALRKKCKLPLYLFINHKQWNGKMNVWAHFWSNFALIINNGNVLLLKLNF